MCRLVHNEKIGNYARAFKYLAENEMIRKIPNIGFKVNKPIEEIESTCQKYLSKEIAPPTKISNLSSNGRVHTNAKSITLQVNNVTITIAF